MRGAQSGSNLCCVQTPGEGAQGLCYRGRTDGSAGLLWDEGAALPWALPPVFTQDALPCLQQRVLELC